MHCTIHHSVASEYIVLYSYGVMMSVLQRCSAHYLRYFINPNPTTTSFAKVVDILGSSGVLVTFLDYFLVSQLSHAAATAAAALVSCLGYTVTLDLTSITSPAPLPPC